MKISRQLFITPLLSLGLITSLSISAQPGDINTQLLEQFSLEKQIPILKGYNVRARRIVVPAGASIDKHAHSTRAGIVYVESGEIVEYRHAGNKKKSRRLKTGETLIEDASTVHSYLNDSDKNCVLVAFDLPTQ
jgi:quercetin dioxygenase-like cupin family protein